MPQTNAQTVTDMADTTLNPTRVVAANDSAEMNITLRYSGEAGAVTLDPSAIFLGIRTVVGAAKIYNQKDATGSGDSYIFVVTA